MVHIINDTRAHRLLAELDGQAGRLDYELVGDVLRITHVEVHEAIKGRGVAGELMRGAIDLAAANHWNVNPACSFAADYLKNHPAANMAAHRDELRDEALDESFPASDPPSVGGSN